MPNEAQKHTKKSIIHERSGKDSQEYNSMNEDKHKITEEKHSNRPESDFEAAEKEQNTREKDVDNSGQKKGKDWKSDDTDESDINDESIVDDEEDEDENPRDKIKNTPVAASGLKLTEVTPGKDDDDE